MKLNSSKTQIVVFKTPQNKQEFNFNIFLGGEEIKIYDSAQFLGIHIDKNINWKPFIELLSNKLNSACFQMFTIRDSIDFSTRMILYYALFFSRIQYGIECWGMSSGLGTIFKIQKKYLRFMTFSNYTRSCRPLFRQHKILTVTSLYIFRCLLFIKNNESFFCSNQHIHSYETRNKSTFQYPVQRLSVWKNPAIYWYEIFK